MPVPSRSIVVAWVSLLMATASCTPIVTIGWIELSIILILGSLILLPFAFRILRALQAEAKRKPKG